MTKSRLGCKKGEGVGFVVLICMLAKTAIFNILRGYLYVGMIMKIRIRII